MNASGKLSGFAISVTRVQCGDVRARYLGLAGKLGFQTFDGSSAIPVEQPEHQTESPHILTTNTRFMTQIKLLYCG